MQYPPSSEKCISLFPYFFKETELNGIILIAKDFNQEQKDTIVRMTKFNKNTKVCIAVMKKKTICTLQQHKFEVIKLGIRKNSGALLKNSNKIHKKYASVSIK